jgi:hypothetical protein
MAHQTSDKRYKFIQYGLSIDLANKAAIAGLTLTNARALSRAEIMSKYGLSDKEAAEVKKTTARQPIDKDILFLLLENSNFCCNICKGAKGAGYIIHHIEAYEETQNNDYDNLIVLCPTDHDLAHRGGLTLGITRDQLRRAKNNWEQQVEIANVRAAAKAIDVQSNAIDYVNIMRIEELCLHLFNKIPRTEQRDHLRRAGILNARYTFDRKFVSNNLSGGSYLFDYIAHSETAHYRSLLEEIAKKIEFADLSEAATKGYRGLRPMEGSYAFFIGGVHSARPLVPIKVSSPPVEMYYKARGTKIMWDVDPNFLMSMSSIGRLGRTTRYIIYCLVRSVQKGGGGHACLVTASPLLIAQPTKYVHKVPAIAHRERLFIQL